MRSTRGIACAAVAALTLAAGCGALLAGCGGGDGDGTGKSEATIARESDVEIMNVALTQEMTLVQVYRHSLRLLRGEAREIARRFLAQEQEHINGITKVLRGLQGPAEGEVEAVDYSKVKSEEDALLQLYDSTGLQLRHYIDDVAHLETIAPRALVTTMAANEAQHLVVLRQLLGADRAESVPEAFDGGEVPPPTAAASGE